MKKLNLLSIIFSCFSTFVFAQKGNDMPGGRNIESLKIAYITRELTLAPEEAQKFWPVYNTYTAELKAARKEQKDDNDVLLYEENVLNIRKKYKPDFKKILISDDRVNKILTIERDFNNVLRKELQQRMQMRNKQKGIPDKV
jgi:hypothetical protein